MKSLLVVLAAALATTLACENVLRERVQEVNGGATEFSTPSLASCNSKVGSFNEHHADTYKAVLNRALSLAFEYMSISSHFGRDTIHRLGFQKLFRAESDARFEQAIDMVKYIVKRGGDVYNTLRVNITDSRARLHPDPLPSLGLVLTDAKAMYGHQAGLHRRALCAAQRSSPDCHIDPDLAHQAQDEAEEEIERINGFARKANTLAKMYTVSEKAIAEHMFDRHLQ